MDKIEEKYIELFEHCFDFSIGDGWMPMIECFCYRITRDIEETKKSLDTAKRCLKEGINTDYWELQLPKIEKELGFWEENPPKIVQVKEKFGGLRLYCYGLLGRHWEWVKILENLSHYVCEDCGKPAIKEKTKGWIRTLCQEHYDKQNKEWGLNND